MGRSYKGYRTWKAYISKDRDDLGRNISLRSGLYNIAIVVIKIILEAGCDIFNIFWIQGNVLIRE
jgi:hypothetical protein